MIGKVKSYSKIKGYGFLSAVGEERKNITSDIFFNVADTLFPGNEVPQAGKLVEFELGVDRMQRRCAIRVRLPGAALEPVSQGPRRLVAERLFQKK